MSLNWLDIALLVVLALSLIIGLIKGFARQLIGLLAVAAGVILAFIYYPYVSELFVRLVARNMIAHFLGFLSILAGVMILGWVVTRLLSKLIKGPLKLVNHMLGGAFGLLKGILICGVVIFSMFVFSINKHTLQKSILAPYCVEMTRVAIDLIPQGWKEKFNRTYREIFQGGEEDAQRI